MDELRITWHSELGVPGVDSDPLNPLTRALDRLLRDGQPLSRLALCFFAEGDIDSGDIQNPRWFGALVHSAGERVLLFLGFADSLLQLEIDGIELPVDHFSLDRGWTRFHMTSPGSAQHSASLPTCSLGSDRVLWFGMSVASPAVFRPLRAETAISGFVPASDARRRYEVLNQAREGQDFLLLSLNPSVALPAGEGFLHFAVIVGPSGFPDYDGNDLGIPFGSPFLTDPLPHDLRNIPIRRQRLSFRGAVDLQFTTLWLPGGLTVPVTLTGRRAR